MSSSPTLRTGCIRMSSSSEAGPVERYSWGAPLFRLTPHEFPVPYLSIYCRLRTEYREAGLIDQSSTLRPLLPRRSLDFALICVLSSETAAAAAAEPACTPARRATLIAHRLQACPSRPSQAPTGGPGRAWEDLGTWRMSTLLLQY